jgi:hypothetical protein
MQKSEFENFDKAVRKILSVSPEEIKRRREEWDKQHHWGKQKPKTSASAPASSSED